MTIRSTILNTRGGVTIHRTVTEIESHQIAMERLDAISEEVDSYKGVVMQSTYEFPGRYRKWALGFTKPMLQLTARGLTVEITPQNDRGRVLTPVIQAGITQAAIDGVHISTEDDGTVVCQISKTTKRFAEEERSHQPSVFSIIRVVRDILETPLEPFLALTGAFAYDLAFQFEPQTLHLDRSQQQREVVLFLPDELLVMDTLHGQGAYHIQYEFELSDGTSTAGLPRSGDAVPYSSEGAVVPAETDHAPGEYADIVRRAKEKFRLGELFEVVPGQTFREKCDAPPSELFATLRERNPSPYGFVMNLGEKEYLVGASPEMYVRVHERQVETSPISGTIRRGPDPMADERLIRELLNSTKEESELSMCTDVDRNDKSRICKSGSVQVIGRRQIEKYSRLIHTVDHVVGELRDGFDALDAFMTHMWAVTVTGAPKARAIKFLEENEKSPRLWYAGAVGMIKVNGDVDTGLTLRTIRLLQGIGEIRAGATLLFDSDPDSEEAETRLKASALLDVMRRRGRGKPAREVDELPRTGEGKTVLLIDHDDSFVHTLANYIRQTGATVVTLRTGFPASEFDRIKPDLVVLSPGPGAPKDFNLSTTIDEILKRKLPIFGVCLGLQALVEYYGGSLNVLEYPVHGKPSEIEIVGEKSQVFEHLPDALMIGRYHSLYANIDTFPKELRITAQTVGSNIVMGIEHPTLPIAAVQFHPESILTRGSSGLIMLSNVMSALVSK